MKKSLVLFFFLSIVLLLCSCGKQEKDILKNNDTLDANALLSAEEIKNHDCDIHGHVYSLATCLKKATCYYCGKEQGPLGDHDWMRATCLRKRTCSLCGEETGNYDVHVFLKPSCAAPSSCIYCGITRGGASAHEFKAATCVSASMCIVCMKKQGSPLGHIWTGGSCTEDKICTRCARHQKAPGHKMSDGGCTEDSVCSVCHYKVKATGHQFENGVCKMCGKNTTQAAHEDETRTTAVESTESTTVLPPIDSAKLIELANSIKENLTQAHNDADTSITADYGIREELADSSMKQIASVIPLVDEALMICESDVRLKSTVSSLKEIQKIVSGYKKTKTLSDTNFISNMISIRGDCQAAMRSLDKFVTALNKVS